MCNFVCCFGEGANCQAGISCNESPITFTLKGFHSQYLTASTLPCSLAPPLGRRQSVLLPHGSLAPRALRYPPSPATVNLLTSYLCHKPRGISPRILEAAQLNNMDHHPFVSQRDGVGDALLWLSDRWSKARGARVTCSGALTVEETPQR